jgi:hypothetical protein
VLPNRPAKSSTPTRNSLKRHRPTESRSWIDSRLDRHSHETKPAAFSASGRLARRGPQHAGSSRPAGSYSAGRCVPVSRKSRDARCLIFDS